jgi:hypothetical protein
VKAFFGAVVLLVIFSLMWNWRFIRAYYVLKSAEATMAAGDLEQISRLWQKASADVPEMDQFFQISEVYKGTALLQKEEGEAAMTAFKNCTDLPKDYGIDQYRVQAQMSVAYNHKDFAAFLAGSKQLLAYDTSALTQAQVASAYSCLYTQRPSDSVKALANQYLMKASVANDTTKNFARYLNLIKYRLATRDMIDREQFEAKFPDGWTNN